MDGREAMESSSGSTPYYRGTGVAGSGSGSGSQGGPSHLPPGFRPLPNPNLPLQTNARPGSSGSTFSIEPSNANFNHGINRDMPSGAPVGEPVKRNRGRPRKYAPEGQVSLGLSPMPVKPKPSSVQDPLTPQRGRGRPPGTGRKQQLAHLGDWMNTSAGIAFSPHVIHIGAGEDIVSRILSFSQQRPRALCVLSGTGTVTSVTLRQSASSGSTMTFEGCFEILCLSGSYLVAEHGGPYNRTGGISAALSGPNGDVIGGAIGMLIAAGPVQVVACSFVHGDSKNGGPKIIDDSASDPGEKSAPEKLTIPTNLPPQNFSPPPMHGWHVSRSGDARNPHNDIDLTRG